MKLGNSNLIPMYIAAAVVFCLPVKSRGNMPSNDSGEFPIPVGMDVI